MTVRQSLWVIFGCVGVVCLAALSFVVLFIYKADAILGYPCTQKESIATLDVHNQRRIIFTGENCFETDSRPIYYEVQESGRVVTPATYFGNDSGDQPHTYTNFFAEGESLVAVLDTTATPAKTVIMQDFNSGESWPSLREDELARDEFVKRKWQGVYERLQRKNPQLPRPEYLNP